METTQCDRWLRRNPRCPLDEYLTVLFHTAGGAAVLLALAITSNRDDIADALYDEGLRGSGDTLAAVLWSISLYFCTPWQTLLIFLGRVDTERPSDWLLQFLANRIGLE